MSTNACQAGQSSTMRFLWGRPDCPPARRHWMARYRNVLRVAEHRSPEPVTEASIRLPKALKGLGTRPREQAVVFGVRREDRACCPDKSLIHLMPPEWRGGQFRLPWGWRGERRNREWFGRS